MKALLYYTSSPNIVITGANASIYKLQLLKL
jgi:hypothetical protein